MRKKSSKIIKNWIKSAKRLMLKKLMEIGLKYGKKIKNYRKLSKSLIKTGKKNRTWIKNYEEIIKNGDNWSWLGKKDNGKSSYIGRKLNRWEKSVKLSEIELKFDSKDE